jgi:hypothetical protein
VEKQDFFVVPAPFAAKRYSFLEHVVFVTDLLAAIVKKKIINILGTNQ